MSVMVKIIGVLKSKCECKLVDQDHQVRKVLKQADERSFFELFELVDVIT